MNTTQSTRHLVQPSFPLRHRGVERMENGVAHARQIFAVMTPTRALGAAMLITGSAVSVAIADAVLGTWGDEHLMLALVILSTVAIAAFILLFPMTIALAKTVRMAAHRLHNAYLTSRSETLFWNAANADPRMMREVQTMASMQSGDDRYTHHAPRSWMNQTLSRQWESLASQYAHARADAYTWACAQQDPRLMADLQAAMARPHLR